MSYDVSLKDVILGIPKTKLHRRAFFSKTVVWGKILTRRSKPANITIAGITSPHTDILAICCKVISSFVIFAVLDLRVCGCRPLTAL